MTIPAATSTVIRARVNGRDVEILVPVRLTVAELLRDRLGLTGTKVSCEMQVCGACTVLVDGNPVSSCTALACDLDGTEVLTVEGLAQGRDLHPVQEAFMEANALQCGFCTPGFIMMAVALLDACPDASDRQDSGVDGRQPVPLHRLRPHRDRGHGGSCPACGCDRGGRPVTTAAGQPGRLALAPATAAALTHSGSPEGRP